jgi:hypothetical protein
MSHHSSSSAADYSINGSDFRVGSPAVVYSSDVDVDASFSDAGSAGEDTTPLHSLLSGKPARKKKKMTDGRGTPPPAISHFIFFFPI